MPVFVTYVDNGDLRVVIETREPYQSVSGRVFTFFGIAYVSLPLWERYTVRVRADITKAQADIQNDKRDHERKLRDKM